MSTFFPVSADAFNDAPGRDVALRLLRCGDGAAYSILITSPDPAAMTPRQSERLLLHTRPRGDLIGDSEHAVLKEDKSTGLPHRRLRRVQEHIDANLDSALAASELAALSGLSVSHFARSFLRSVGMTPHSYVLRRRVLRAEQLLEDSELSMVEIAMRTGFSDQSHFCRRFRELVGLPPTAFRARRR